MGGKRGLAERRECAGQRAFKGRQGRLGVRPFATLKTPVLDRGQWLRSPIAPIKSRQVVRTHRAGSRAPLERLMQPPRRRPSRAARRRPRPKVDHPRRRRGPPRPRQRLMRSSRPGRRGGRRIPPSPRSEEEPAPGAKTGAKTRAKTRGCRRRRRMGCGKQDGDDRKFATTLAQCDSCSERGPFAIRRFVSPPRSGGSKGSRL
jgi:hypothetical protein